MSEKKKAVADNPFYKKTLDKLWLKYTNRPAYNLYKWELRNYQKLQAGKFLIGSGRLTNIGKIISHAKTNNKLNIMHSGNAGDIIYALPTIKKIQQLTGVQVNLYLRLDQPAFIEGYSNHPLGGVMMNTKMAEMLLPLIEQQEYITGCGIYTDEQIDIDMDYFRTGLIPQDKGNIARWCSYITGVTPDLWKKWLTISPDAAYANSIVVARSGRYNNKLIDYSFISKYKEVNFIGIADEFEAIKQFIPHIKWIQVANFAQMAQIIAGCKVFIGNQSFPYSIAEGLKVPRILEVSFEVINVIPEGENGHDFMFQDHFEWLVENLYNSQEA